MTTRTDSGAILHLQLLGPPALFWEGRDIAPELSLRQRALLFMLALEARPVSRSRMALMLWADRLEVSARANLRVALTRLRQAVPGVLSIDARGLSMTDDRCASDLAWLSRNGDSAARPGGSAPPWGPMAWPGPLLEGFELEGSEAFTQWLRCQRERVSQAAGEMLRSRLLASEAADLHEEAIALARRLLDLDGADESAHMALMRLLAATGRRWAALEQYETCRQLLAERLGARPSTECYALYVRIHAQAAPSPGPTPLSSRPPLGAALNRPFSAAWRETLQPSEHPAGLPASPQPSSVSHPGSTAPETPARPERTSSPLTAAPRVADPALIGRERELMQLEQMLSQATSQWVSLLGPPGIGKSALARELAARLQCLGSHDLCWIDAAACGEDWPLLLLRMAQGWGGRPDGTGRRRLIVLDGVADVGAAGLTVKASPGSAGFNGRSHGGQTLQEALPPRWQVLTTSRRPLALAPTWSLPLQELSAPAARELLQQRVQQEGSGCAPLSGDGGDRLMQRLLAHTGGWPWALEVVARLLGRLGEQALLQELRRLDNSDHPGGTGSPHWLDEACMALDLGPPFGLALQVHEAWQALPLKTQAAVQSLAALGNPFEAGQALLQGATLGDLRVLREHGWLQPREQGQLGWGMWCRATVASLGDPALLPTGFEGDTATWPDRRATGFEGLNLRLGGMAGGAVQRGGAASRPH